MRRADDRDICGTRTTAKPPQSCGDLTTAAQPAADRIGRPLLVRKQVRQEPAGRRLLVRGHLFGRARGDDPAAAGAPFGPEVDHVVGRLDHVEVVLDDDDRVALVDELVQHVEQLARVLEMQAGRRLVEDVERAAGAALRQLLRQLHALRLAARQRRRRLAELDVAEADVLQRAQLVGDRRKVLEQRQRLIDRQVEHVGDRLAAILDLERLAVVAAALALLARDVDVGQEVHLDRDHAVALARLAAAALDVEREAARLEAARLRVGHHREQIADEGEQAGVGGRIRSRRAADRRLIDLDHLVDQLDAFDAIVRAGLVRRPGTASAPATCRGCR